MKLSNVEKFAHVYYFNVGGMFLVHTLNINLGSPVLQ
jgi:hypothetical protein